MLLHIETLCDAAIATSAEYFSGGDSDGSRLDPKWYECTSWNGSISVAAHDGITADALTKLGRLAPDLMPEILERFGAHAIVID
jgi:thiamine biosynthesis lipoprotein ApbE